MTLATFRVKYSRNVCYPFGESLVPIIPKINVHAECALAARVANLAGVICEFAMRIRISELPVSRRTNGCMDKCGFMAN